MAAFGRAARPTSWRGRIRLVQTSDSSRELKNIKSRLVQKLDETNSPSPARRRIALVLFMEQGPSSSL